ncbi:hypothetical protein midi_00425 [Candidatus Midichloria mitochondrii IricVA]|uniref:Uncharacterized protein n=2 Tax=Candidatus Midichloria mitochondrii TaxID=234827 RepID=F7XVN3_MIDMI|nr:hypothetical protein midi_00425 [Candidatus Midichloria mitochondrii IricVA]
MRDAVIPLVILLNCCKETRTGGGYVQEKLDKSCNSTKSLKDIEVLEIEELCTYIKKRPKNGSGSTPLY